MRERVDNYNCLFDREYETNHLVYSR